MVCSCSCSSSSKRTSGVGGSGGVGFGSGGIVGVSDAGPHALISADSSTVRLGTLELHQNGVGVVTVTNIGAVDSAGLSMHTTDDLDVSGCSGTLPMQSSCTLTITAYPREVGPWSGTVTIAAVPFGATSLQVEVTATVISAKISLSPETIALGNILFGDGVNREVVTLSTSDVITDLAISTFGPDVSIDRASTTCGATLAAGVSCVIVANITMGSPGTLNDAILVGYGGATGPHLSVRVTGKVQVPATLALTGSQDQQFVAAPGQTSPAITLAVANIGDFPTGDLAAAVTGDGAADFLVTSDCLGLREYGTCTIGLAFAPSPTGAASRRTAALSVTDTNPGGSSVAVSLSGIASTSNELVIYPDTSDLGQVALGATGDALAFTVRNTGGALVSPLAVSLSSSEFLLVGDTCTGNALASQATCVLSVAFAPASIGTRSAVLTVAAADAQPAVKMFTGTSMAVEVPFALPSAVQFFDVDVGRTSAPETIMFSNDSQSSTGRIVLTVSGDGAGRFQVSNNNCAGILSPGQMCSFDVTFIPMSTQAATADINITDGKISANVGLLGIGFLQM